MDDVVAIGFVSLFLAGCWLGLDLLLDEKED